MCDFNDTLICPECGSSNKDPAEVGAWRWNGEHWEHRCGGLNVDPVADDDEEDE
jgi:hypothetical protein